MTGLQTATTYEEDELSDEDEYLFCDGCDVLYHGDCPIHGPLAELDSTSGYDKASLAYTQLPVPTQLTVKPSSIPGAGLGVFSTTAISTGVRVGPYEGKKISREDMGDVFNTAYAWEVRPDGEESYFVDGSDPSCSNWMRFVNCARYEEEQNLLAYQYHGNIYYRTFKTISPHTELLVWYGDKFARELGIVSRTKGSELFKRSNNDAKNRILDRKNVKLKYQKNYYKYKSCNKNDASLQIKTQTADKPYQCDYCEYRCSHKGSLQKHIRTHTGEKPYQCDYCEYRCSLKYNLQKHIRTHTGEKPYQCDYCEYRCSRKGNLQKHIRIHTGEKPYQCDYCEYRCSRKGSLQQHIRTHTGDKPYQCDYCEYRCSQKGNLQKHITNIHTI